MHPGIEEKNIRSCAFILLLDSPVLTLADICMLLNQKMVGINSMQYQILDNGNAKLIIVCELAKDRIGYIGRHFEKMTGVRAVDWMNARTRIKQY